MRNSRLNVDVNVVRCLGFLGLGCALAATGAARAQTPVYYEDQTLSEQDMAYDNSEFGGWLGTDRDRLTVGMVGDSLKYRVYKWLGGQWYHLNSWQYMVAGAADATVGIDETVSAWSAGEQDPGVHWVEILLSNGQFAGVFSLTASPSALAVSFPTLAIGDSDWDSAEGWVSFKVYNDEAYVWDTGELPLIHYAPAGSDFGAALALDERILVVGAPHVTSGGAGEVYVFLYDPQDVVCLRDWCLWDELSIGETGDRFGAAVALDGDWIAVGAPLDDDDPFGFADRGRVYLYERSTSGHFTSRGSLGGSQGGAQFGTSVALTAGSLLVGAPGEDLIAGQLAFPDVGAAYLYRRAGTQFEVVGKLISSFLQAGMRRGTTVGLNGYTAVVGAPFVDLEDDGYDTGAVFSYSIVPFFFDGFESGDTTAWSAVVP